MFLNREPILKRLQEHWDYAVRQGVDPDRIVGVFLYGSQNYGFANPDSDVDSKLIIVPSFEDMCLKSDWLSKELHLEDEHIEVKDIRELRNMFLKQNINFIEILYTDYFILNPKYAELWKTYFVDNREAISHCDRNKALKSISGQLIHTLKQGPTDNKKLHNAHRLYYFLENYLNNKVYLECIHPEGESYEFLRDLKFGLNKLSQDEKAKLANATELEQKVKDLTSMYPELESPLRERAMNTLNNGVMEIIKLSLQDPESEMSKEQFFKQLTNAEQRAYYSIVKEIGAEGNITISKLVEKNSISRPVYNNLIVKMKEYGIAAIVSQGMKGTNIKILQPELKAEAIDFI